MKDFFNCLFVIIGTIIGAGFASGREILDFFNVYEKNGLWGICISSLIFGVVVILVISIVENYGISEYSELVKENKILKLVLKLFSCICFCIMISGIGSFAKEQLNISFVFGTAIASFICYTMFLGNFKSIEVISSFLVPVIILGIVILGISDYEGISKEFLPNYITSDINYKGNWLVSSILYASYNSLILIPILINLKKYNLSRFKVLMLGVATFFILGILMFFIYKVNAIFYPNIMLVELPNMMYASLLSSLIKNFYSVVIIAAIFTTAFSCGFSFLNMLNKKNYKRNALLLCIVSFFCSGIGFSNMINICFPIFGYLGIFQIVCLIYRKNRF